MYDQQAKMPNVPEREASDLALRDTQRLTVKIDMLRDARRTVVASHRPSDSEQVRDQQRKDIDKDLARLEDERTKSLAYLNSLSHRS